MRKYISDIFNDEYLIAKILHLKQIKGIESDLRFLFEKSFYKRTEGKVPETEADDRTDLRLPLEPECWIEMKCYDGVLTVQDTQGRIKKDISSLARKDNNSKRIFIYFGLYGKRQLPNLKSNYIPATRIAEIKDEIEKIQKLAIETSVNVEKYEYHDLTLSDRIIYAAWFYLK